MKRPYTEREQWLIDRIGKVVFRNKTSCSCEVCAYVFENGLLVHDEYHALYMAEMEECYTEDGQPMRYFDTKEETIAFLI